LIRSTGPADEVAADTEPVKGNAAEPAAPWRGGGPTIKLLATAPPITVIEASDMMRTLR